MAASIDLGGCTATVISGGTLKLDGGAMFGIIPKPLWTRQTPADEQNRIQLACNCVLVEWPGNPSGRRAIIETGHGDKFHEKELGIYAIDPARWLLPSLQQAGVDPASITDVVLSHLHFDHAGGLTQRTADGPPQAAFPAARVHVQRRELEDARANFGIMTNTYRAENFAAIDQLDAWRLIEGEADVLPGIRALPTPGHTRAHQSLVVRGSARTLVFSGDVMPTRAHCGAPYNMAYDVLPLDNRESKRALLAAAAERDWLIVLDHEAQTPVVTVAREREWFTLKPVG